jgi:hypothetical protein
MFPPIDYGYEEELRSETVTVLWFSMDDTNLTFWIQIFELQAALLTRSSRFWNYKQAAIRWLRNFVKNDGNFGIQLERERSLLTPLVAIEMKSHLIRTRFDRFHIF